MHKLLNWLIKKNEALRQDGNQFLTSLVISRSKVGLQPLGKKAAHIFVAKKDDFFSVSMGMSRSGQANTGVQAVRVVRLTSNFPVSDYNICLN